MSFAEAVDELTACRGKKVFESPAMAYRVLRRRNKRNRARNDVYRCTFCGKWHLGTRQGVKPD